MGLVQVFADHEDAAPQKHRPPISAGGPGGKPRQECQAHELWSHRPSGKDLGFSLRGRGFESRWDCAREANSVEAPA
jgi:hypothetical protein